MKVACSSCGEMTYLPLKEMKYLNHDFPFLCCKECLLREVFKLGRVEKPVEYKRIYGVDLLGQGEVFSAALGISFRSRFELKVAEFLLAWGVKFEYESIIFEWDGHIYIPDFYLPEHDCFLEVKGSWRLGNKSKLRSFQEAFPEVSLILVPYTMRNSF
jgi:hypothetical protein